MADTLRRSRRLLRRGRMAAVLVVLTVGVWQGVAGASATSSASARVEYRNQDCGLRTGNKKIGTVKFERSGNTVKVNFRLTKGRPDTTYLIVLYAVPDSGCEVGLPVDFLVTDAQGKGHVGGKVDLMGNPKKFFASAFDGDVYNDSLIVNLP